MIHAKKRELRKAFETHHRLYNSKISTSTMSQKLLLFYAVECGLKYLILDENKKNSTRDFEKIIETSTGCLVSELLKGTNGHDINRLLNILKYNLRIPPLPTKVIDEKGKPISSEPKELNQIWRYGIECDYAAECKIENMLVEAIKYIQKQIRG
ncbi:MAG TPA: hypothetical protein DIW31_03955 [Bacteroidales bacterium]|nr:hypothetical protein [Bacteroidales bacterium]